MDRTREPTAIELITQYNRWKYAPPGARTNPVTGPEIQIDPYEWMAAAVRLLDRSYCCACCVDNDCECEGLKIRGERA